MALSSNATLSAAIASLLAASVPNGAAASPNSLFLSKQDARCIIDNIGQFLDEPQDPVTVYLDICIDDEDLDPALLGRPRAELPNPPSQPEGAAAAAPKSVVIAKSALRCLRKASAAPGFLDKDPVSIDLDACPR